MKNRKLIIENGVLKRYAGFERNYRVPSGIRIIDRCAFSWNTSVRTVTIPEGVAEIGDEAFMYCGGLERVSIPGSVVRIGKSAFSDCVNLETVEIPCGVKRIEEMTFHGCRSLKRVIPPDGLEEIGESAFADCIGLSGINFPDSLKKIGNSAFQDCHCLKPDNDPDCVPDIGENAFGGCDPQIPEAFMAARKRKIAMYTGCIVTVTNLRRHNNADNLQCTTIHGHNVIVDDSCRLGELLVYFPVGGQLGEEFARENHLLRYDETGNRRGYFIHPEKRNIVPVTIRGEVSEGLALPIEVLEKYTDIASLKDGDRIFALNGHQICCVFIPEEIELDMKKKTLVRYRGRKSSPERVYIPWGTKHISDEAFMNCTRITEVCIPETVKTIGRRAFYGCSRLGSVRIPDSVTSIGEEAFAHCPARLILPEDMRESEERIKAAKDFIIQDGVLTGYKGASRDVVIPEGVTEIGEAAFVGSKTMERVVIPKGVTKIGDRAFKECTMLKEVSIPYTVRYIGYQAFFRCKSLSEVDVPPGAEFIGRHAFGEYYYFRYVEGLKFPVDEYRRYEGFRLRCAEGSRAEYYAIENHLSYSYI